MYHSIINIITIFFILINGRPLVKGVDSLPNEQVIFAATHRSATDPFYLAIVLRGREIAFMAKESLFKFKPLGWLLKACNVFPVNREKPSTRVIKHAVKELKEGGKDLGIFPTGSRYSTVVKGGTAFIQKLSQKDIIPVSIQPPKDFWEFISRKKAKIIFGQPIPYQAECKYKKADLENIDAQISQAFDELDHELDPNYKYVPQKTKS